VLRRISGLKRKYQEAGENCIMRNSVIRNATKCFSVDEVEDFVLRRTWNMRCTHGKSTVSSSENLKENVHFGDQLQIGS
jgi:hypothetical protein